MEAARLRQTAALPTLTPGDKARISVLAHPKYLRRMSVHVLAVTRKHAYVRFDVPSLAGRYGPECNIPRSILAKVD